jgi:hypothetical protein
MPQLLIASSGCNAVFHCLLPGSPLWIEKNDTSIRSWRRQLFCQSSHLFRESKKKREFKTKVKDCELELRCIPFVFRSGVLMNFRKVQRRQPRPARAIASAIFGPEAPASCAIGVVSTDGAAAGAASSPRATDRRSLRARRGRRAHRHLASAQLGATLSFRIDAAD